MLSDTPFGEDTKSKLEQEIQVRANEAFNMKINCGGYALRVDGWVNPSFNENFDKTISGILETFPFVRLIGDSKLGDDEYLVIYRAPKEKNTGHHFIRVDDDGVVREKDGRFEPQVFEDWDKTEEDKMAKAIFAVKKDHKMFDYKPGDYIIKKGLDFEETIQKAVR